VRQPDPSAAPIGTLLRHVVEVLAEFEQDLVREGPSVTMTRPAGAGGRALPAV